MYIAYIYSFQFLKAYEIAILTIFTPIFVIFIYDFFIKNFVVIHWLQALLAILGSVIIVYSDSLNLGVWKGIILLQVSNFLFALGQVYYRKIIDSSEIKNQKSVFGIIFFGAVIITGLFSAFNTDFSSVEISSTQWITLLYLGGIASGLGFFLWNFGATKVEIGSLAVFNNLKIPLGVVFSILLLGESVNLIQLGLGSIIIFAALFLNDLYITKKIKL
jgi:drug/metabolite transporter (DMT)-like permease